MIKKNYRYSLFNRFVSLLFLVFLSIIFCIGWKLTKIKKDLAQQELTYITKRISQKLENDIHYIESKMRFMSNLISIQTYNYDYQKISNLLNLFFEEYKGQLILLSAVGWAGPDFKIQITNFKQVDDPIDISKRSYTHNLKNKPFTLLFDQITTSQISSRSIIPIAMGIKDKKGLYLGCVTSGVDILNLKDVVETFLLNKNIYYAILNTIDDTIIASSPNFNRENTEKDLILFASNNSNEQLYFEAKQNYIFSKIAQSPFILITGSNFTAMEYQDFFHNLLPYKFELLFAISILCCLIYLFYISILEPFMTISNAALHISNGHLDVEIKEINSKEGSQIVLALEKIKHFIRVERELVDEVSEARNSLAITNLRLENKVAKRTEELEKALLIKTTFLDHLNHEIMLPILGINNIAENLTKFWYEIDEVNKTEYTKQIAYTTKRLLSMVNNLLDLSKFSNGEIQLNLTKFDLAALIKEIINECKLLYLHSKNIQFNFIDDKPVYIAADRERTTQLLFNLLVNAIKFSPDNGDIAINIIPTRINIGYSYQEAIHVMIHDRGVGLDEKEIANIFTPFTQGKNSNTIPGSVGLGLTICKEIVSAHNGKIWAMNNKDGGATFNFILPTSQPTKQKEASNMPGAKDLHHALPNILIIDDEEVCLNSMELLLHNSKYNLIKTNSGQAGLKYVHQYSKFISLIMLDLMMPDMYGLNVLTEIKNDSELSHIPIILQTGTSDEDEIVKAFDMGVTSFIRKPYKKSIILEEIEKALKTTIIH